jgi:NAD(P)-dependent dehydrogenase (short-subunit alcohol dehydrogenase family)
MSHGLHGKVALVTGAGRNIGRQVALTLAAEGCDVVVNVGSDPAAGDAVRAEIQALGRRAISVVADIARPEQVSAMVRRAEAELGTVDILVNSAAIRPHRAFVELTEADWREVVGVNLDGPFFCCKETVPGMIEKGWGAIVNISGTAAWDGGIHDAHIVASKAGLHGLTKALAVELGEHGIRVNSIVLGGIETVRKLPAPMSGTPIDKIPLRRRGQMTDVADTIAFLVSDAAAYITGQAIHVNGGALLA